MRPHMPLWSTCYAQAHTVIKSAAARNATVKVAHKFDDGWCVGTYRKVYKGKDVTCQNLHHVYYQGHGEGAKSPRGSTPRLHPAPQPAPPCMSPRRPCGQRQSTTPPRVYQLARFDSPLTGGLFYSFQCYHELHHDQYGMTRLWVLVSVELKGPQQVTLDAGEGGGAGGGEGTLADTPTDDQERPQVVAAKSEEAQLARARARAQGGDLAPKVHAAGRFHSPSYAKAVADGKAVQASAANGANIHSLFGTVSNLTSLADSRAENARAKANGATAGSKIHTIAGPASSAAIAPWWTQPPPKQQPQSKQRPAKAKGGSAAAKPAAAKATAPKAAAPTAAAPPKAAAPTAAAPKAASAAPLDDSAGGSGSAPKAAGKTTTAERVARRAQLLAEREAASAATGVRYSGTLDNCIPLPAECIVAFFDFEHTCTLKGGSLQDVGVWEFGTAAVKVTQEELSLISVPDVNVNSMVHCLVPAANEKADRDMRKAGATPQALAAAPELGALLCRWLEALKAFGLPVVVAAHGAFTVDFKLACWSLKRAGHDPYQTFQQAHVIAVLDTTKLVKLLPRTTYELLPKTDAAKKAEAANKSGAVAKHRDGSNKALYEALVAPGERRRLGSVVWHRAHHDAMANARWVISTNASTVLRTHAADLRGALISLEQMVLMVDAKSKREV